MGNLHVIHKIRGRCRSVRRPVIGGSVAGIICKYSHIRDVRYRFHRHSAGEGITRVTNETDPAVTVPVAFHFVFSTGHSCNSCGQAYYYKSDSIHNRVYF